MQIQFYKYQGAGNDFVILDNRDSLYKGLTKDQKALICDRRFGIGADGLMLLNKSSAFDFEMEYYNADGNESSMCGNGGRCLTRFASDLGMVRTSYSFTAIDGSHESVMNSDGSVSLKMKDVNEIKQDHGNFILDTGSPHYIVLTTDVMHLDVFKKGRDIRYHSEFRKEGINVNFVEQLDQRDRIIVRTYERGVEDETFSCGTGVTASAIICAHNDNGFNRVEVQTKGGLLNVEYDKKGNHYSNIWLTGPAEKVFEGTIEIN